MTANRFRVAAWTLIAFNIIGTILTWAAHLQKPGTSDATALASGTQFTGPIIGIVLAIIAIVLTRSGRRPLIGIGMAVLILFGFAFATGEITELFHHNIGISTGRWDIVIIGSVTGAIIGITEGVLGVGTWARMHQTNRPATATARATAS